MTRARIPLLSAIFLASLLASPAQAGRPFFEFNGGVSRINDASPVFGDAGGGLLGLGFGLNLAMGYDFSAARADLGFSLGLQHRFVTGSTDTLSFAIQGTYPFVRVEMAHFYLSAGFTNFLWKRAGATTGIDSYARIESALAIMSEIGFSAPITPQVSFLVNVGGQFVRVNSDFGPKPTLEGCGGLRFYFGGPANFSGNTKSQKDVMERDGVYEGWRYPFGGG